MKKLVLGSLALGMMCACTPQPESINVYLQKRVGIKRQYGSMMGFTRLDTLHLNQLCPQVKVAPEGLTDIAYYFGHTDFPQAYYQAYRQGKISNANGCSRHGIRIRSIVLRNLCKSMLWLPSAWTQMV